MTSEVLSRRVGRLMATLRRLLTPEQMSRIPDEVKNVGPYDFDALPAWLREAVLKAEAQLNAQ